MVIQASAVSGVSLACERALCKTFWTAERATRMRVLEASSTRSISSSPLTSTTDPMIPGTSNNCYMFNLLQSYHGYLTEVAPVLILAAVVAERWQAQNGGTT